MLKSHNVRGFFICLGITIAVLAVFFMTHFFDVLELKAIDYRFKWRGDRPANQDIVIITVDEESIKQLGRWPWPRATHAKLARKLHKAGAKVVAFDSLFTEKDRDNPQSDTELARAAAETGIVVSAFFYEDGIHDAMGQKPLYPYDLLLENSEVGFVNLDPDEDGTTRRAPLVVFEESKPGEYVPRLSLSVAALALSRHQTIDQVMAELPVNIDHQNLAASQTNLFVNYAYNSEKPFGSPYPLYSYADVLNGKIDADKTFNGKIVFVGATAAALFDLKAIPYASIYPGVMVHANVVDNLIAGNYIHETTPDVPMMYVLILGVLLGFLLPRLWPWAKLVAFVALVAGGIYFSYWQFASRNSIFPMVPMIFTGIGCYGGILFYRLVVEEREKRKIKGSFRQYLSPKIIEIITRDPSKLKLGGEEREVTVFFLDIAGFTTMSEALKPTQLVEVMNQCLTTFSNVILKHEGLINKYIGDCIMAFWNAPIDQPNHAGMACLAALDCIKALPDLNRSFQEKGLPSIDCRVGINTGTVVVGNMGSQERFDYTVMGDPVNLASRLEGANKEYHTHIMPSDVTFDLAKDTIEARDIDLIRVKGKKEPRKVFEILCRKSEMNEELRLGRDKYHEALKLYRQQKFQDAVAMFDEVFRYMPNDHLTRKYLERARAFAITPPPANWDGVFEMKSK